MKRQMKCLTGFFLHFLPVRGKGCSSLSMASLLQMKQICNEDSSPWWRCSIWQLLKKVFNNINKVDNDDSMYETMNELGVETEI